jgi:hypothetical protein
MIYDIKVFDKHGNLNKIIDGNKAYQIIYGETSSPKSSVKGDFFCKYCDTTVLRRRPDMVTCGNHMCRNKHKLSLKKRKPPRKVTCRICSKQVEVNAKSRQVTCGKECSEENNRRTSLAAARKRHETSGVWDKKRRAMNRKYKTREEIECQK